MIKRKELSDPSSCINRAHDEERVFVLLGRDEAAPSAILFWAIERIRLGKNKRTDPQIVEALSCAVAMNEARQILFGEPGDALKTAGVVGVSPVNDLMHQLVEMGLMGKDDGERRDPGE